MCLPRVLLWSIIHLIPAHDLEGRRRHSQAVRNSNFLNTVLQPSLQPFSSLHHDFLAETVLSISACEASIHVKVMARTKLG